MENEENEYDLQKESAEFFRYLTLKSGLEFAPQEPMFPIHPEVIKHWENITNNIIPFGYNVEWKYN